MLPPARRLRASSEPSTEASTPRTRRRRGRRRGFPAPLRRAAPGGHWPPKTETAWQAPLGRRVAAASPPCSRASAHPPRAKVRQRDPRPRSRRSTRPGRWAGQRERQRRARTSSMPRRQSCFDTALEGERRGQVASARLWVLISWLYLISLHTGFTPNLILDPPRVLGLLSLC